MAEYIAKQTFLNDIIKRYCEPCKAEKKDYKCHACWVDDLIGEIEWFDEAIAEIENALAANVKKVKHGKIKWMNRPLSAEYATVIDEFGEKHYGKIHDFIENNPVGYCGECGKRLDDTFMKYCPNCGAKMVGGE